MPKGQRVYILSTHDECGAEQVSATLDPARLPDMLRQYPGSDDSEQQNLVDALGSRVPGPHALSSRWGGVQLHVVDTTPGLTQRGYVLTQNTPTGQRILAVVTDQSAAMDWATSAVPGSNFHIVDIDPAADWSRGLEDRPAAETAVTVPPRAALADPGFTGADKVHDWRNHVGERTQAIWASLSVEQREAIAADAQDTAGCEEWD